LRLQHANVEAHHFVAMVEFAAALQEHLERLRHVTANLSGIGSQNFS
jgi:hypothetical protein